MLEEIKTNKDKISRDQIASKITHMISLLHTMGYESLYLYCGRSPNGMNWRYEIGISQSSRWPVDTPIIEESITHGSIIPWVNNTESIEVFAKKFISTYLLDQLDAKKNNHKYTIWYQSKLNNLLENEPLVLYADYDYEYYDEILRTAPGYQNKF